MTERYVHHHFHDGVYLREAALPAGAHIRMHRHKTDHMSLLVKGNVEVTHAGLTTRREAPAFIMIPAGEQHEVRALSDVLWYCTHITDESDEARIDEVLIDHGEPHAVL